SPVCGKPRQSQETEAKPSLTLPRSRSSIERDAAETETDVHPSVLDGAPHDVLHGRARLVGGPAESRGPAVGAARHATGSGARADATLPSVVRRGGVPARRKRRYQGRRDAAERVLHRSAQAAVVRAASVRAFELSTIGGPWGKRLESRRAWIDELP